MPRAIHLLALGIFTMVTSEFVVAGLMPQMADGLHTTVPKIGYLITAFAAAMAVGGPPLAMAVGRLRPRPALLILFAAFLAGNVLAALATSYPVMVGARIITGVASQAFIGTAITTAVRMVPADRRGRAVGVVLNGLMIGTLLGMPLSTLLGEHFGWRAAFWTISTLTLIAAIVARIGIPDLDRAEGSSASDDRSAFTRPRLWLALSTSTFIIGATFAAFSYLNPILTEVTGFSTGAVPLLLIAYGAATVVGNMIVGRLADRHTVAVQIAGLLLNVAFLTGFALFADVPVPAVVCMLGIGLVGVTMNPAMATRVQRAGNTGTLVNTVHSSFITLGIIVGSSVGGALISAHGLRAPLWTGAALAVAGLATLLPDLRTPHAPSPTPAPTPQPADAH
ncbi:MFS transporter [Actinomadura rupiterrae]|uniref:MFS transporter n=1 Tax=Actinomadura rupiterrae TaxID=559627 RepID=UPI0020A38F3C|nr:MFS transporter [Actinomadura rupiterrae]MCP2335419.1 putative MFS family arabinose efflux permease [Actinomadura rupiterrae]